MTHAKGVEGVEGSGCQCTSPFNGDTEEGTACRAPTYAVRHPPFTSYGAMLTN